MEGEGDGFTDGVGSTTTIAAAKNDHHQPDEVDPEEVFEQAGHGVVCVDRDPQHHAAQQKNDGLRVPPVIKLAAMPVRLHQPVAERQENRTRQRKEE